MLADIFNHFSPEPAKFRLKADDGTKTLQLWSLIAHLTKSEPFEGLDRNVSPITSKIIG
jgi:hypothetical protein